MINLTSYGEATYCLKPGKTITGKNQAAISHVLEKNQAVGMAAGYFDDELRLLFVSQFFLDLLGYDFSAFAEKTEGRFLDVVDPADRARVKSTAFAKVDCYDEFHLTKKDGKAIRVFVYKTLSEDSDGRPIWVCSIKKIVDKEEVEEILSSWTVSFEEGQPTIQWSPKFLAFLGNDRTYVEKDAYTWLEYVHPDDRVQLEHLWRALLSGRYAASCCSAAFRLQKRPGEWMQWQGQARVIRDADGKILKISGVNFESEVGSSSREQMTEIVKQQKLYHAYHDAIAKINLSEFFVDLSDDSYFAFKMDGPLAYLLDKHSRWSELVDTMISTLAEPESVNELRRFYSRDYLVSQLTKDRREISMVSRMSVNGTVRWVTHTAARSGTDQMDLNDIIVYLRDATEKVEAERHEAVLHHNLESTLKGAGLGIWTLEYEKNEQPRLYADQTMRILVGIPDAATPEEAYRILQSQVPEDVAPKLAALFESSDGHSNAEITYKLNCPERPDTYVRFGGSIDKSYTLGRCYKGYYQDVTRQVQKEEASREALTSAYEAAKAANAAKTDFLSKMSHDIRTPLNGILGMSEIALSHVKDSARVTDSIQKIAGAGQHLSHLVEDVLRLSKIESNQQEAVSEKVNLPDFINGIISLLTSQIASHGHSFQFVIEHLEHEYVYADTMKLKRVLINLLDNAVKYTPDGGTIRFRLSEEKALESGVGAYRFVIEDNGIGMAADYVPHIFEPFCRADDNRIVNVEGTGLGMCITANLVRLMGGTIDVESELGKGTKFTIVMDMKQQTESRRTFDGQGLCAVVADDDPTRRARLIEQLDRLGVIGFSWNEFDRRSEEAAAGDGKICLFVSGDFWDELSEAAKSQFVRRYEGKAYCRVLFGYTKAQEHPDCFDVVCTGPLYYAELAKILEWTSGTATETAAVPQDVKAKMAACRVLLVDDNALNMEIGTEFVRVAGAQVEGASDGREAVEKFKASPVGYYSLILMDMQMPVMTGCEATAAIRALDREDAKTVPIVAMSANAFSEDVVAAKKAGMDDYISKPVSMEKLEKALKKYLIVLPFSGDKVDSVL